MPGHVLIYRDGKYEIKSYFKARLTLGQWEESQENSNVGTRRDENVNELKENNPDMQPLRARLETILDDSVKHHMLSDVEGWRISVRRCGFWLSGSSFRSRPGLYCRL